MKGKYKTFFVYVSSCVPSRQLTKNNGQFTADTLDTVLQCSSDRRPIQKTMKGEGLHILQNALFRQIPGLYRALDVFDSNLNENIIGCFEWLIN